MMFQSLGQLGDDNSYKAQQLADPSLINATLTTQGTDASKYDPSKAADCQWCAANPWMAFFAPSCAVLSDEICTPVTAAQGSIAQGYIGGSTPATPPPQFVIDSQTPTETVDQILQQTQINAVAGAVAAANNVPTSVCTQGTPAYNAFACFMKVNGGTVLIVSAVLIGFAFIKTR